MSRLNFMKIIEPCNFITTQWAGGSTTQLWIWPPKSNVAERDFELRISMARVEQGGPFSDFSGYQRALLLLSGEGLKLEQRKVDDSHVCFLFSPNDPCWYFAGRDTVRAELLNGPVQDFNLIAAQEHTLNMVRFSLDAAQLFCSMNNVITTKKHSVKTVSCLYGLYLHQGELNAGQTVIKAGQLVLSLTPLDNLVGSALSSEGVYFACGLPYLIEI